MCWYEGLASDHFLPAGVGAGGGPLGGARIRVCGRQWVCRFSQAAALHHPGPRAAVRWPVTAWRLDPQTQTEEVWSLCREVWRLPDQVSHTHRWCCFLWWDRISADRCLCFAVQLGRKGVSFQSGTYCLLPEGRRHDHRPKRFWFHCHRTRKPFPPWEASTQETKGGETIRTRPRAPQRYSDRQDLSEALCYLQVFIVHVLFCVFSCRKWEGAAGHRGCRHETCGRENSGQTAGQDALWQGRVLLWRHLHHLKGIIRKTIARKETYLRCLISWATSFSFPIWELGGF